MESLMECKLRTLWRLWKDWNERRISGDFAMHEVSTVFWGDIKKEDQRQRLLVKSVPLNKTKRKEAQPKKIDVVEEMDKIDRREEAKP